MELAQWKRRIDAALEKHPLVEIAGRKRVFIENHQGILAYLQNEIHIKVAYGCVIINGENLQLLEMSNVQLVISGRIESVQLLGG